ncbi:MAG: FHA domain-containing protein [Solirubrobacterales bacterium]
MPSAVSDLHLSGTSPGAGTFSCSGCGCQVSLEPLDRLPRCPSCGASSFRRASIFEHPGQQTAEFKITAQHPARPGWLKEVRRDLAPGGRYLVCHDPTRRVFGLERGWSRIGRSVTADVRLDDPSVSRRHALAVWEPGEPIRILDDRSLNGIALNGRPVDWGSMVDGDELRIGRYRLYLIET